MRLDEIQSNLFAIVQGLPFLASYVANGALTKAVMLIDDGNKNQEMEEMLNTEGLVLLIMPPQCTHQVGASNKQVTLNYSTTIWVRTNPKIKPNGSAWNPLTIEHQIIPAVIKWTPGSNLGQRPFFITEGLEPETDFSDVGNNSRLIRFSTQIIFSPSTQ